MALAVGIVGLVVVFKAIHHGVVVHIDAEEEIGRVDVVAQEWLFVVRGEIGVFVEIREQVVVFVEAGEDGVVAARTAIARPIDELVLIVVVVDVLEPVLPLVFVIHDIVLIGDVPARGVPVVHAEHLAVAKVAARAARGVDEPRIGRAVALFEVAQFLDVDVGIALELGVAREFAAHLQAQDILDGQIDAGDFVGRGQPIVKANDALVGVVAHIAFRAGDQ